MQLNDQPAPETLAQKLGDIAHVSGLARRLARKSGAGENLPEWLLKVAVERGARHYAREFAEDLPPDIREISDEEIGIALCLYEHPYQLDSLRAAAQLLSFPRINRERLLRLAEQERCEPVLLHVAEAAARVDAALEPWLFLRANLRSRRVPRNAALPHLSRLVSQTGVTAFGGPPKTTWLYRHE